MEIIVFKNKEICNEFEEQTNLNANLQQKVSKRITTFYEHTDGISWWCYRAPLENPDYATTNGAITNKSLMNNEISKGVSANFEQLDLTKEELIEQGYLPEPSDINN
jgi:hypothetical protein